ncbi:alpha-hydroxy acid oxidase [Streptomyces sp. B6B3]|uniref:alpha-hydroxy acid oxidase n=1 Tax=Streptomyces sp. B6B3 TaxID=3153570 RepID=UPI00325E1FC3
MTPPGQAPCTVEDYAERAEALLPRQVWDFLAGGSGAELTLAANREALRRTYLTPRVLRDVSGCGTATTLLGRPAAMPVAVAPVAFQRLFHEDGERATAQAAKEHGVPFVVSTMSSVTVEEVVAAGGSVWFQVYWLRDRARTFDMVRRAEDAGCEAVMVTVDMPWMGRRPRDLRNGFSLPAEVRAVNLVADGQRGLAGQPPAVGSSALAAHSEQAFSRTLGWEDVRALRARTRLPLVLKGILAPEDARRAAELGVDAVVVSNHGGRQLDGAVPSIDALAGVGQAVAGACEVLLDGGVRSGTDVLKALACGATGVLVGRPAMWGLAVGGAGGVREVLDLLAVEFRDALGLAGCGTPEEARALEVLRSPAAGCDRCAAR